MTKIKAVFLRKIGQNNYEEIHTETIKEKIDTLDIVSYNGKTFPLPKEGIFTAKRKRNIEIFFDFDNEKIICFKEHGILVSAEALDKLLFRKIIAQLVQKLRVSLEPIDKFSFLGKLIIPILCLVVGFFFGASGIIKI